MFNFIIIFIGLTIAAVSCHPYYGHQHDILTAPSEYRQRPITYNKHFHFFTAPEEPETTDDIIPESFLRRNIRVVIIKAPENKRITSAITQLATSLAQEKTAIYVLNKEPDITELHSQIKRLNDERTERPDVHFVKYKTAEDAELAAINIQSQFEYLSPSETTSADAAPSNSELIEATLRSSSSLDSTNSLGAGSVHTRNADDSTASHVSPSRNNVVLDKSETAFKSGNASDIIGLYLPPGTSLPVDIRTQTLSED